MLKFGTGQITAIEKEAGDLPPLQVHASVELTETERAGILAEGETESEGE